MVKHAAQKMDSSYYDLTVAAIHARSLAQFLGLKLNATGSLASAPDYFRHEKDSSGEVKLTDVTGKPLLEPANFSLTDISKLEKGFDTINREVAHLTAFKGTQRHQSMDDPTKKYYKNVVTRTRNFCEIILREVEKHCT